MSSSSSTTRIRGRSFIPASYHPNRAIPAPRGDCAGVARILICEPHDDIGALLELVVRRLGHEPVPCDEAAEAVDVSAFDAAVIEPGDERGLRLARVLRATNVPVLFTSIYPAESVAPGYVFIAQKGGKSGAKGGTVIADNQGRIRWFHQLVNPLEATDFRAQTYEGKPVLTWWEGGISKAGVGVGRGVIYDDTYTKIATVKAGHGLDGDLHEFQLTPRGTAFISVYHEVPADLTSVGGPKHGWVYDSVVQEIDVSSGDVVFEWHSLDHVPLTESMQANHEPAKNATKKRPLDYFHVNSVADAPGGNIVISGRNTSAIYLLARDGH